MLNHVIAVGQVLEAPQLDATPGGAPRLQLRLELTHAPRDEEAPPRRCRLRARVLGRGAEVLGRLLTEGEPICLEGHLEEDREGLLLQAERWEFLGREVVSRPLWREQPAARRAG